MALAKPIESLGAFYANKGAAVRCESSSSRQARTGSSIDPRQIQNTFVPLCLQRYGPQDANCRVSGQVSDRFIYRPTSNSTDSHLYLCAYKGATARWESLSSRQSRLDSSIKRLRIQSKGICTFVPTKMRANARTVECLAMTIRFIHQGTSNSVKRHLYLCAYKDADECENRRMPGNDDSVHSNRLRIQSKGICTFVPTKVHRWSGSSVCDTPLSNEILLVVPSSKTNANQVTGHREVIWSAAPPIDHDVSSRGCVSAPFGRCHVAGVN